jgi:hypothetical protein
LRFSELYHVACTDADDWFDPLLVADTALYPDPFRIYADGEPEWTGAHEHLLDFFEMVLQLIKEARGNEESVPWKKARQLLLFPEPAEFCMGVSEGSVLGAGSGKGLQADMLEGGKTAVGLGIQTLEHMELLALFRANIGPDRIGDTVCNVLKSYFIRYTQTICQRHGVRTIPFPVEHASWSLPYMRWEPGSHELPENPFAKRRGVSIPVLLCPQRFLRDIPTADPSDFWSFAWSNFSEELRNDFNYDIAKNIDAREKARLARLRPDIAKEYLKDLETAPKPPYDLGKDPDFVKWYEAGRDLATRDPLSFVPSSPAEFNSWVRSVIEAFGHGLEHSDMWRLLWDGDRPRSERMVQALFRGSVMHYCRANRVMLSGESNAGRGPVDFKFAQDWSRQALVEVKLTSNSGYWKSLEGQLVEYLRSEELDTAFFVSVGFEERDFEDERMQKVRDLAKRVSDTVHKNMEVVFLDAQRKRPPSKL